MSIPSSSYLTLKNEKKIMNKLADFNQILIKEIFRFDIKVRK